MPESLEVLPCHHGKRGGVVAAVVPPELGGTVG